MRKILTSFGLMVKGSVNTYQSFTEVVKPIAKAGRLPQLYLVGVFAIPSIGLYSQPKPQVPNQPIVLGEVQPVTVSPTLIQVKAEDPRKKLLQKELKRHKAPLADQSQIFLDVADRYGLDWRLLPAISILESSGGRRMVLGSHNAWGWGGGYIRFNSWEQAMDTIGKSLREKYINQGYDTPEKMNRKYAESKTWGVRIKKIMTKINPSEAVVQVER